MSIQKIPSKIYLQWFDEDGEAIRQYEDIYWCEDQINKDDPCYILQSTITNQSAARQLAVETLDDLEWAEETTPQFENKYCPLCLRYLDYGTKMTANSRPPSLPAERRRKERGNEPKA